MVFHLMWLAWEDTITCKIGKFSSVYCGQEPVCGVPTGSTVKLS